MAKLLISAELMLAQLFHGAAPGLRLNGASFDAERKVMTLDIEGPGVPVADEVIAVFRRQEVSVEFRPLTNPSGLRTAHPPEGPST